MYSRLDVHSREYTTWQDSRSPIYIEQTEYYNQIRVQQQQNMWPAFTVHLNDGLGKNEAWRPIQE